MAKVPSRFYVSGDIVFIWDDTEQCYEVWGPSDDLDDHLEHVPQASHAPTFPDYDRHVQAWERHHQHDAHVQALNDQCPF
jgi:hypothetical protein